MTTARANVVLRHVRELRTVGQAGQGTDHQLLERFAQGHDRDAFAVLVRRHGPLVLGYLQGKTCDEAAGCLGWSRRTLQRRLDQARQVLRARLARRGLALPAGLLLAGLTHRAAAAAVPPELAEETVRAGAGAATS